MAKITVKVAPIRNPYGASLANAKSQLLTPQQNRTIANQQVGAQIKSALGGVTAASNIEQRQYTDLAERAAGIAKALGSFGPSYGTNSFNAYNQAAQTVGQLGTGLTGSVASDWQGEQAANQAAIQQTLGPGLGKVESYDPAAMRSALQYGSVTLPGAGLASQALTSRDMAQYGAMADQAQVARVSQDAISEARKALDARAAERSAIVAKRPELFQEALKAQREDAARTQTHVDNLVTASQSWLQNQQTQKLNAQKFGLLKQQDARAKTAAEHQWWLQQVAATHVDPDTGKPVGGYVWADKAHTTAVPWNTKKALDQNARKIGISERQGDRTLDISQQRANDWKTNAAALAKLRATTALNPGKYDDKLSAQLKYLVDANGRPITDADGALVPYKPKPGKPAKPLDTVTRVKLQASMANYADALKNGAKDPKDGHEIQKAVDIRTAIQNFAVRGYLQGVLLPWGRATLANAYGLTEYQLMQVANGIDPATGGPYGAQPGDVGPPNPNAGSAQFLPGRRWDTGEDPAVSIGIDGMMKTKSGHWVNPKTKQYIK